MMMMMMMMIASNHMVIIIIIIPTPTRSHSSLFLVFVFNPQDLYYRGYKNNNNNIMDSFCTTDEDPDL